MDPGSNFLTDAFLESDSDQSIHENDVAIELQNIQQFQHQMQNQIDRVQQNVNLQQNQEAQQQLQQQNQQLQIQLNQQLLQQKESVKDKLLNKWIDSQITVNFTTTFDENPKSTLPFIGAIDAFIDMNGLKDKDLQFKYVMYCLKDTQKQSLINWIKTEEEEVQAQNDDAVINYVTLLSAHNNMDIPVGPAPVYPVQKKATRTRTVDTIKNWLIALYPPPRTNYDFQRTLRSVRFRKNENPMNVIQRFQVKLRMINEAIKTMNKGITIVRHKVSKMPDATLCEILGDLFIRKNNRFQFDNKGEVNKCVCRFANNDDPTTYAEWVNVMKKMEKKKWFTNNEAGISEFQFISYPPQQYDTVIYMKDKQPKREKSNGYREKKRGQRPYEQSKSAPPKKRFKKGVYCRKCNKEGHYAKYCYFCPKCKGNGHLPEYCPNERKNQGKNGKINKNQGKHRNQKTLPTSVCYRCGNTGHKEAKCYTPYHADGHYIGENNKIQSRSKQNQHSNGQRKRWDGSKGSQPYAPTMKPNNRSFEKEVNVVEENVLLTQGITNPITRNMQNYGCYVTKHEPSNNNPFGVQPQHPWRS